MLIMPFCGFGLWSLGNRFILRITEQTNFADMPVSRMRMRPWLEKMIESRSISGLEWMDKEKTVFCIPWKHAARHGWEMDKDACLFKKWAIHTGKYTAGQAVDPKTWKANFRCAMNSLPDIEEVKDKSINKGHQAVRVYRLLPVSSKSKDKRRKSKDTKTSQKRASVKSEDMDYNDPLSPLMDQTQLPENTASTQENTVDSTEDTQPQDSTFINPSEVPDWSMSVEIGPDSTNELYRRFEVSPEHSSDYDYTEDIIQICQQMEKDAHWLTSSFGDKGVLSNEACTESYSFSSPGSQWSDSSSADELEDLPRYTVLGSDFGNITDDLWGFSQQIPFSL
ncbi:hypothetical protein LDENG_00094750 [Lucifuga dentata]|nr:hypothetical protein LDENG_00094750 [Lucifuga dentata]